MKPSSHCLGAVPAKKDRGPQKRFWAALSISFVVTELFLFRPSGATRTEAGANNSISERTVPNSNSARNEGTESDLSQRAKSTDTPMIRRNRELIETPNPAMTNVVSLVERYAQSGWLKTGLLEDAALLACVSTQLNHWRSDAKREHERMTRRILHEHPDFPLDPNKTFNPENDWRGVDEFYFSVFTDRFRNRYGIDDPEFTRELMRVDFGHLFPDFRTFDPPKHSSQR
jgi:hypothetical protein